MTRFNRTLIWMAAFLALVAALGSLVGVRLLEIFQANPFFNGVILIVLAAGIVVNVRQVVLLSGEAQWIDSFRRSNPKSSHMRMNPKGHRKRGYTCYCPFCPHCHCEQNKNTEQCTTAGNRGALYQIASGMPNQLPLLIHCQ